MKRIKLLTIALVIAVAGALHAAARAQNATDVRTQGNKPACCKAHKTGDKQAEGDSCDVAGGDCCRKSHSATKQAAKASDKGGCACCDSGCCAHDKKGTQASAGGAETMSCDASGDCCQTCDCCNVHKSHAAHESASAGDGKGDGASCCAGCSCCGARQTARR